MITAILIIKIPAPALAACSFVLPETSSPISAPNANPMNIPNGAKKKIPIIIPIVEPIIPAFEALKIFPPKRGIA